MNPLGLGLLAAGLAWLFLDKKETKMPALQKHFEDFHSRIKLDIDDEKANLREKRDTLVNALKAKLPTDVPAFEKFHQGSYSMHTGVVPLDGNYDIDVGIVFDCDREAYPDPVDLKKKVRDALNSNGRTVVIRRPCVTVNYVRDGVTQYHVDLAIYAKRSDGLLDLAKGKEQSGDNWRHWEVSDPKRLTQLICDAFDDDAQLAQYRRCIRYIKRWRDVQFRSGGAPLSIALTVAARDWFRPRFEASGKPADLLALLGWVKTMLSYFDLAHTDEGGWHSRLEVKLPAKPYSNLMEKLTKSQMANFKDRLIALRDALEEAYDEDLPEEGCKLLNKQFGDAFVVPAKADTAKATTAAAVGTGNSA